MIMSGKLVSASGTRKDENCEVSINSLYELIMLIKTCEKHRIIICEEADGTYRFVDYDDWWE